MSPVRKLGIGCAGLVFNCFILGPATIRSAWQGTWGDFLHFYAGFKLAPDNKQYDVDAVLRLQERVAGTQREALLPVRLPFYYRVLSPIGKLSFAVAHIVWPILLIAAAIGAVALYPTGDRPMLAAASLASLPLALAICLGQDISFLALVLAAGLNLRGRGKTFTAGVVCSFLSVKFHLVLLVPLLFVLRREFRLLGGMAAGAVALIGLNFALAGHRWIPDNWAVMSNPNVSPAAGIMPNLHGLNSYLGGTWLVESALMGVVAIAVWQISRWADFEIALAATLAGSLLMSYHSYVQDLALLVPGLLSIWLKQVSIASQLAFVCLTPVVCMLTLAPRLGFVAPVLLSSIVFALWLKYRSAPDRSDSRAFLSTARL